MLFPLTLYKVVKMFEAEKNVKHRLLLMVVYASGLRVSEAVKLKRKDIDILDRFGSSFDLTLYANAN